MSCGVGHKCGSSLVLLWLWPRLEAAALVRPPSLGTLHAMTSALKKTKNKTKQTNKKPIRHDLSIAATWCQHVKLQA